MSVHSGSNWNLGKLVFKERGNRSTRRKTSLSRVEKQQQTQPTYDAGSRNRTRDTLVGGERSHHCAIPAPLLNSAPHDPVDILKNLAIRVGDFVKM